ncbi:alpha/beta hydrolase [Jiella sp. MQZ9-1]|uniref:Alpha/beta hydrolase n=1 Tax=Jiella flava TaxID=2816857 RepID=A0A939G017_9HYPH|nr:alpha/beta hydrolase [Jiella flava]MCD2471094.1 alpha/beta hydrolase [Jiella flava]
MKKTQLVVIPGLLSTHDVYRELIDVLGVAPFVADTLKDDTIAAMARRVLEAAPGQFVLCGHSMGGYVALEVVRLAPQRVAGLALLSTSPWPDSEEQTALRRRLVAMAGERGIAAVTKLMSDRLFGAATRTEDRDARNLDMALAVGPAVFARQQAAIITRRDQRPLLPSIDVPTVIVTGTSDQVIATERSQEMAAAICGARLIALPDVGHMVPMEAPEATADALQTLIATVEGAS